MFRSISKPFLQCFLKQVCCLCFFQRRMTMTTMWNRWHRSPRARRGSMKMKKRMMHNLLYSSSSSFSSASSTITTTTTTAVIVSSSSAALAQMPSTKKSERIWRGRKRESKGERECGRGRVSVRENGERLLFVFCVPYSPIMVDT